MDTTKLDLVAITARALRMRPAESSDGYHQNARALSESAEREAAHGNRYTSEDQARAASECGVKGRRIDDLAWASEIIPTLCGLLSDLSYREQRAALAEREACAKVADDYARSEGTGNDPANHARAFGAIATGSAIRSRSHD